MERERFSIIMGKALAYDTKMSPTSKPNDSGKSHQRITKKTTSVLQGSPPKWAKKDHSGLKVDNTQ